MKKITVSVCWLLSLFSFIAPVSGNSLEARSASAIQAQVFEVNVEDVKTRPIKDNEKDLQKILSVAYEIKVEKFLASDSKASLLTPRDVAVSLEKKIQEHPKWNVPLNAESLARIAPHFELLKNTLGQKSYGWAWFLKQNNETAEAKKVLLELYEDVFKRGMQMSFLGYENSNPVSEMQFIQTALSPMCDMRDIALLNMKMLKIKRHFSNLPQSNFQT